MPPRSPARPWQYALLAALLAVAVPYHALASLDVLRAWLAPHFVPRPPVAVDRRSDVIWGVEAEARRAGARAGDRLLAVEGRPYAGQSTLLSAVARRAPGDGLSLTVASRDEPAREARVVLARRADADRGNVLLSLLLSVAMPLLCLGLGFLVALLRPWDRQAWLLLLLLLGLANFVTFVGDPAAWPAAVRAPTLAYHGFFGAAWPVGVMLFGLSFPEPLALDRRHPWLKWLLLAPMLVQATLSAVTAVAGSESFVLAGRLEPLWVPLRPGLDLLFTLTVSAGSGAIWAKTQRATNPDVKRRLTLVFWGGQLGLGPVGLIAVPAILLGRPIFGVAPDWLTVSVLLWIPVFPALLAYAVLVHRALDLRDTIRQGLQYALARGGIRGLQVLVSGAVVWSAAGLVSARQIDRPGRIAVVAVGIGFVFVARALAERLLAFTDRRFFREAYDAERLLAELSDEVRTIADGATLLRTVTARIGDTLHVPRVALLLVEGDALVLAHAIGTGEASPPLPVSGRVAARLARERRALFVYADDPASWLCRDEVPEHERAALSALQAQLLLPLGVKDGLTGVLALGPRLSEQAYSKADVRLLSSVAAQTALALENARLAEAVADAAAQRARMEREIEIAREVQESLYPQVRPAIPGLDFAGRCRPARGVGGDYYDFRALCGGTLSVAVGDVSGKGVPAALLMASLQASIRGQELAPTGDLGALMASVNRLLYESSPSNRYATLFYGRYDPGTRGLRYVNAGHNPPLLFRASGPLERLRVGGPVVGLITDAHYESGEIGLCPGDTLVLYSDGVSEAMSAGGEEWGEERLTAAVREASDAAACAALDHVFAAADAFAAGAEQYDDMTLVVLRVCAAG